MSGPYFQGATLDDVMREVIESIIDTGDDIEPSQGKCREVTGVLLEVANPRARLSRTETRGRLFSCLGELCWYLAGSNRLDHIAHYIKDYALNADDELIIGGYGPRLFDWKGLHQIDKVIELLRSKPSTRQAVIQLIDATDVAAAHRSIPCTCTLQFLQRKGLLHLIVHMRSNDVYLGLPHDAFSFTMIQEIVAQTLGVQIGTYRHFVGSLHLYERNLDAARDFLSEGWQQTVSIMPVMPQCDPWPGISMVLEAETQIRSGSGDVGKIVANLQPYWADLVRLLQIHRSVRERDRETALAIRDQIVCNAYLPFIDQRLANC